MLSPSSSPVAAHRRRLRPPRSGHRRRTDPRLLRREARSGHHRASHPRPRRSNRPGRLRRPLRRHRVRRIPFPPVLAGSELEVFEQAAGELRKGCLVVEGQAKRVEFRGGLFFDPGGDELSPAAAAGGGASPVRRSRAMSPTAVDSGTSSALRARTMASPRTRASASVERLSRTPAIARAPRASTRAASRASKTARASASAGATRE